MIRPPVLTGLFWSSISCLSNWVSKTNDASTQKEIFLTQEVSNIFFLSPLVSKKGGEGRIVVAVHTCVTQSTSISPPPYGRQGTNLLSWVVKLHLIFGPIIRYFFFLYTRCKSEKVVECLRVRCSLKRKRSNLFPSEITHSIFFSRDVSIVRYDIEKKQCIVHTQAHPRAIFHTKKGTG